MLISEKRPLCHTALIHQPTPVCCTSGPFASFSMPLQKYSVCEHIVKKFLHCFLHDDCCILLAAVLQSVAYQYSILCLMQVGRTKLCISVSELLYWYRCCSNLFSLCSVWIWFMYASRLSSLIALKFTGQIHQYAAARKYTLMTYLFCLLRYKFCCIEHCDQVFRLLLLTWFKIIEYCVHRI